MYLIDHVAELRFVNRLIYAIKRIYTHTHTHTCTNITQICLVVGDILGLLLDTNEKHVVFSLNGHCLPPYPQLFSHAS